MIDFDTLLHGPALAAFAEPVRVIRTGGVSFDLRGVFDRRHFDVETGEGPAMSMQRVGLYVRLAELPAGIVLRAGDRVTVRGVTYQIIAPPELDAMGGARLPLGAVQP